MKSLHGTRETDPKELNYVDIILQDLTKEFFVFKVSEFFVFKVSDQLSVYSKGFGQTFRRISS